MMQFVHTTNAFCGFYFLKYFLKRSLLFVGCLVAGLALQVLTSTPSFAAISQRQTSFARIIDLCFYYQISTAVVSNECAKVRNRSSAACEK